ncbi:metallophosphoesterase family protein [Bacteroidota bacterium]
MNHRFRNLLIFWLFVLFIQCNTEPTFESDLEISEPTPWTNLNFNDQSRDFNFAIVSDRSGGNRPGIFKEAILKLNQLNPSFVLSIGDLIDSRDFKEDSAKLDDNLIKERWLEVNNIIKQLNAPFFFTVGNNDIRNRKMEAHWIKRFGYTYYYFKYQNTLFIILNSEDPPGNPYGAISERQLSWLERTLQENVSVRWTYIFLHRPIWQYSNNQDWRKIEELVRNRSLTVFAGHHHRYSKTNANDQVYYRLATTGGGNPLSGLEKGEFDHIVWVSMNDDGPKISNLLLNGIWGDDPPEEWKQNSKTD